MNEMLIPSGHLYSSEGLTQDQLKTLDDWEKKFKSKYEVMGTVAKYE